MNIIIIGFALLIVFLILGMPVVYAFGLSAIVMVIGLRYDTSFIMTTAYFRISSFILLCIPLFVLAGGVIERAQMGKYLIDFINKFIGQYKCSLAYVSVISCGLFGALTGSAAATATCIGSIMTPRLKAAGYSPGFIGALFANASMLGLLIPPSSLMIVVAFSTGLNPLTCFMSTLLPGILLIIFFCIVSYFILRKNEDIRMPEKETRIEWVGTMWPTTRKAIPILMLPVIILGGIYGGLMTPTESAAVGAFYAILAAIFIYHSITLKELRASLLESGTTAGVIMMSIFMVGVISKVLTYVGLPEMISDIISSITANPLTILFGINVLLIVIGMFMDDISAVLITAPIFLPVASQVGIDSYHFVAIMGVNLGMAAITPPTAPSLFTCCRVCKSKLPDMLKPDLQFIIFAWIPTLILTTLIPDLALYVPRMMGLL